MRGLKPIYTAPSEQAATDRFDEFAKQWQDKYPAIVALWRNAWAEFVPFLEYDVEIRKVICTTNAIESINARYRRAIKARGHFPSDAAALKCLESAVKRVRDHLPRTPRPDHQREPRSDPPFI